jgi:hypothetical protein
MSSFEGKLTMAIDIFKNTYAPQVFAPVGIKSAGYGQAGLP